ncbi:hypothetical protein HDU77_006400 [Chytriomyces hyalinus]|nr:hypothetical protein HDU77_006400 [Chytriomyces hyalinus]
MPPAGANTATLSMILRTLEKTQVAMSPAETNAAALSSASQTLEKMQATMAAMQQEVADCKETQLSILIGQPDLLTKPNPDEILNQCLLTAVLSMHTADTQKTSYVDTIEELWIHLPDPYQSVVASVMSGQLKDIGSDIVQKDYRNPSFA